MIFTSDFVSCTCIYNELFLYLHNMQIQKQILYMRSEITKFVPKDDL